MHTKHFQKELLSFLKSFAGCLASECVESCDNGDGNFPSVCESNRYYVQCRHGHPTLKMCGAHEIFVASSAQCGELTITVFLPLSP